MEPYIPEEIPIKNIDYKGLIVSVGKANASLARYDGLFYRPVFQTSDFVKLTGIPKQTALPMLRKIKDAGILTPLRSASGRQPSIYAFKELLNIAEGKKVV